MKREIGKRPSMMNEESKPYSRQVTVQFQIDETAQFNRENNEKTLPQRRRKKSQEFYLKSEVKCWSTFFPSSSTNEEKKADQHWNRLSKDDQAFSSKEERLNRSRLALIERNQTSSFSSNPITSRSIFGTMFDLYQLMENKQFSRCFPSLRTIIIFIDSIFRAFGQINFVNNPLSGLVTFHFDQRQTLDFYRLK